MPTIPQLPVATATGEQDELPVSQAGITRSVTVAELLANTQPALVVPSQTILGRASLGPGGPEPLQLGAGVMIQGASVAANGADHLGFVVRSSVAETDEVVLNSNGTPARLSVPALRGLYTPGTNVTINATGQISAATDAAVTSTLASLGQHQVTTDAAVAALSAKIPTGGFVGLNAQGQITAPMAGPVTLGTVTAPNGGVARTLGAKSTDVLNVVDFGAVAGGADCSVAFAAAFAALPSGGGEIWVPAGDYWLNSPQVWVGKPVALRGAGKGATKIRLKHGGIGFDFAPISVFDKVILRDFSAYAENVSGQTAAVARITYPTLSSFGYATTLISGIECFGYPNAANGLAPFPQTFNRGFVLNGCWSTHLNNVSWFGPPAAAGATSSAVIELNRSFDTRIDCLQGYYGNTAVLQTGYCEGVYISCPVVVGMDYLFRQTDETTWTGYVPNRPMLLGLWVSSGEVNTNLGTVQLDNVTDGFFTGLDVTRDGGPNTSQSLFDCTNVSNFHVLGCNFVGGPAGGGNQDVAFNFKSTWNSSGNVVGGCHFENLATVIKINGSNGTVGLTTFGLRTDNVPMTTAIMDNTPQEVGNLVSIVTPAATGVPAAIGNSKDHVFADATGAVLCRINNVAGAANYIRLQPAGASNPATLAFDGSDTTVNGVAQTKGGNLYINASGGASGSGGLLSLLNIQGSNCWVEIQNAKAPNMSQITTNAGGLQIQPRGPVWLSPSTGLFVTGLPTIKPAAGSNQVWNNAGVLSIS